MLVRFRSVHRSILLVDISVDTYLIFGDLDHCFSAFDHYGSYLQHDRYLDKQKATAVKSAVAFYFVELFLIWAVLLTNTE
ncbi:hypothetical protein TUM4445_27810 [Shewanella sp. MBTL60-112-B2]|nr:hypothetical protein TUM4444_31430 [Shewanella sp. MBTL60-112-B1]GIU36562.1 hypothetical protein TUM4445_27810 [Shewanella sp. MBTL60-112-B2]